MSERNQVITAGTVLINSVDWDRLDPQSIIEAVNQGQVGKYLTDLLASRSWEQDQKTKVVESLPKFEVKDIFNGVSFLEGAEFMRRAKALPGAMNGNKKAFEYYSNKAHWAELPKDVDVIVFVNTEFDSDGYRCVRYLYRSGAGWCQLYGCVGDRFNSCCRVAVLASPLDSATVVS